jgi:hypothetical protein
MDRKEAALKALRVSAARCQDLHHQLLQDDDDDDADAKLARLAKQVQSLGNQVRLCGDMDTAMHLYRLGDRISGAEAVE